MKWYCLNHEDKKIDEYDDQEWKKFGIHNSEPPSCSFMDKDGVCSRGYGKEEISRDRKKILKKLKSYLDRVDSFRHMAKINKIEEK